MSVFEKILRAVRVSVCVIPLVGAFACVAPSAPFQRFFLETRLVERDSRPLAKSGGTGSKSRFLLGARETMWIASDVLRVDTEIVEPPRDGERRSDVRRQKVRSIFDFARREIWRSEEGGPFRLSSLLVYEYEIENARRAALVDLVDSFVREERARLVEDPESFRGDGAIEIDGPGADRLSSARVAVIPGRSWKLTVEERSSSRFPELWSAEILLFRVLGLTRAEARYVAASIRGLPLRFRGTFFTADDKSVEEDHRFLDATHVALPIDFFSPPREDMLRERAAIRIHGSWESFFDALIADAEAEVRGEAGDLSVSRWLGELLEFESRGEAELPATVEDVWKRVGGRRRVELMRLALRHDLLWARTRLAAAVNSGSAVLAQAAAEALFLADDPDAVDAVLRVLRRRRNYTEPIDPGSLVEWALPLLRTVSGLTYEELGRGVGPFWSGSEDSRNTDGSPARADPREARAQELDYWLRWGESRRP